MQTMEENDSKEKRLKQQRTFITRACYWGAIIVIIYLVMKYCVPVWFPFVIAAIVACILNIPVNFVSSKLRIKRSIVALFFVILFYGVIAIGLFFLVSEIVGAVGDLATVLPSLLTDTIGPALEEAIGVLEKQTSNVTSTASDFSSITDTLNKLISSASGTIIKVIAQVATSLPGTLVNSIITIIVTAFITIDFEKIRAFLVRQIPEDKRVLFREMKSFFGGTVPRCLGAYIFIMTLTFSELTLGFILFGISNPVLLGLIIAVVDILPVLGTGTVLIPWAIVDLILGNFTQAIQLIILYLVITIIRNTIEPKLVGSQIGLHPVVTFAGMLFGLKYMGFLGMFGVPLTIAFILSLNRKGIISVFK